MILKLFSIHQDLNLATDKNDKGAIPMKMRVKEFLYTVVEKLQNNIAPKYTYELMSALPGNY